MSIVVLQLPEVKSEKLVITHNSEGNRKLCSNVVN